MRKLEQQEVNNLDRAVGAIPIGLYVNSRTKREYQCINCGCSYFARSKVVRKYKQLTCAKCSYKIRCDKQRLTQEYVEKEFQKRDFILDDKYIDYDTKVKTICKCGKTFYTSPHSILQNDAKSCGHCKDPQIEDRFGRLKVIIIFTNNSGGGGCQVVCECECGRYTKILDAHFLRDGCYSSCGNCSLKVNGIFTSYIALRLHGLIEQITGQKWKHNYNINGIGYIDIANVESKIAIEYDGYYNHKIRNGDCAEKDKNKIKQLIKNGWRVLNIRSDGRDIPTKKQLSKILLNDFQHETRKRTITMKSWYEFESKHNKIKGDTNG